MQTATQKLRDLWAAGDHRKALKLAASWPRLGKHDKDIKGGWAAISNPSFYRQLGKDPVAMYAAGITALADRYNLDAPKETT